ANAVLTGFGDIITRERRIVQTQGQALTIAARDIREQFEGRGSRATFFARERSDAMRIAAEEAQGQALMGTARGGISIFGGIAAGAAAGAKIGAGLGTVSLPVVGTVGGAALGGVLGGIGGGALGLMGAGERGRAAIF